jgi:hypothetical protein
MEHIDLEDFVRRHLLGIINDPEKVEEIIQESRKESMKPGPFINDIHFPDIDDENEAYDTEDNDILTSLDED